MEKIINKKALGVNVKKYRQNKNFSVERLSEKTGISTSHIKNIESASTNPSAEVLVHIANALDVPVDILLGDSLSGEAGRKARVMEYSLLMEKCTAKELKIVTGVVEALLKELRNNR
jgi:transcriptional regulator with XRE-family HTH domain